MKILIVDDSKLNLAVATSLIKESNMNLDIFFALSGEEALSILKIETDIEIVLLDIIMGGISGIDTLKEIIAIDKEIKVIMYSSVIEKKMLQECFTLGAVDYINKPVEKIEFISRIKNVIRQKNLENKTKAYIEMIEKQKTVISKKELQLLQQDKMAGIGQLAAGVAHEMNNPLGFVVSNFQILKEYMNTFSMGYKLFKTLNEGIIDKFIFENDIDFITEDINGLFEDTEIGLQRVVEIVKSLRNFSRVDITIDAKNFTPYDLNKGLKDTLTIANNSIKYSAKVIVDYGDIPEVNALGNQINQVILNILMNSIYAINKTKTKGLITIYTKESENYVLISIKDNGTGIKSENIISIFNPFYTTKPPGDGTGLGLSLSYDIIHNRHDGKIAVFSEYGKYTEFIVYLKKKDKTDMV